MGRVQLAAAVGMFALTCFSLTSHTLNKATEQWNLKEDEISSAAGLLSLVASLTHCHKGHMVGLP